MKPIVVKIGGSTLGNHDTTIEDLVVLQKKKVPVVAVHGGGKAVNSWLAKLGIPTTFINGLRVTDFASLEVVTAVLCGLVNKELVSAVWHQGGKAVGISGADGVLIKAVNKNPWLKFVGEEVEVDVNLLRLLLKENYIPVVAPISLGQHMSPEGGSNLLNVNGDTAAAEIASALCAEKLIFLTDVPGLLDSSGKVINQIDAGEVQEMVNSGIASGGMAAKIAACLGVLETVSMIRIIDGRTSHALLNEIEGKREGTTIV